MGKLAWVWSSGMISGYHTCPIQQDQEWNCEYPFQSRIKASQFCLLLKILDQNDMGKLGNVLIRLFISHYLISLEKVPNTRGLFKIQIIWCQSSQRGNLSIFIPPKIHRFDFQTPQTYPVQWNQSLNSDRKNQATSEFYTSSTEIFWHELKL